MKVTKRQIRKLVRENILDWFSMPKMIPDSERYEMLLDKAEQYNLDRAIAKAAPLAQAGDYEAAILEIMRDLSTISESRIRGRLVTESIMDMNLMQDVLGSFPETMAGVFGEQMMQFFWDEDSEQTDTFRDTSEAQWEQEVFSAEEHLVGLLVEVIEKAVQETETMLHDGQFRKNR